MKYLLPCVGVLLLLCGAPVPSGRADRAGQEMVKETDAELNRVYQKTLAGLQTAEAKSKLRDAQRAWIAFRDAEAALLGQLTDTPLDTEEHIAEMNKQRTRQLRSLPTADDEQADTTAASDEDSSPLARDYRVRCQVGLVVHAAPDAKSTRVGTLKNGQMVQLDGKKAPGQGNVFPVVSKDSETAGATWIKLKAPLQGYVLFQSDDSADNDYLVPQVLGE